MVDLKATEEAPTTREKDWRLLEALRRRRLARVHTPWDFRREAERQLPHMVFDYIDGGAGSQASIARNVEALADIGLVPSAPADVSVCDQSIELFGERHAMPVIVGPTGLASASWPRGEVALARSAARQSIPFVLANAGSVPPCDVVHANPERSWFQLYPPPSRDVARLWLEQVRASGFRTIEVTVDVAVPGRRLRDARNGFVMPFRWTPSKLADVVARPAWAAKMLIHGQPEPYLKLDHGKAPAGATQSESRRHRFTRALSWDLLKLLRDEWRGPLIIKGLLDPRQAAMALSSGFDAIVISNHGGRQLDGAVSPTEMLPEFRSEVGGRLPLLIDGGFRTGTDVIKAIALGATAVQLGRMPVFALATAGEAGVDHALQLLKEEIGDAMALCGVSRLDQLGEASIRYARR
jgi:(S)-mandelate dehydrogenase